MKIDLSKCNHPLDTRWQGEDYWKCCICLKSFWGKKDDTNKPIQQGSWVDVLKRAGVVNQ